MSLRYLAILIAVSFINSCGFEEKNQDPKLFQLRIDGEITEKTFSEFKSALESIDKNKQKIVLNAVQLNSYGGSGDAAREIGKIIRERKLNTYLASDAECASACVHILISGIERYAFGNVRVHRSTFSHDIDRDDVVEGFISEAKKSNEEYVKSMGISHMLADAMETTPSWSIRQLTELEKEQWQVFGYDRLAIELYFNQTARERHISRKEFIDIFKSNYDDCTQQARELKETVFECVKTKKLKESDYYFQFMLWLDKKLDRYEESKAEPLSFNENIESLRKKIRNGKLYLRYSTISELNDSRANNSERKSLNNELVQRMEDANKWWVEDNKLSVLIVNPTNLKLKEIHFELSTTDCKTESGVKHLLSIPLLANLEANNAAIYSGQLPFEYSKVIGKGTRCGMISAAFV